MDFDVILSVPSFPDMVCYSQSTKIKLCKENAMNVTLNMTNISNPSLMFESYGHHYQHLEIL